MFCIKTYVFIVSGTIQPVGLPNADAGTFVGVTVLVSGFGRTSQSKCVDPFNLYSTDYTVTATWI